MVIFWPTDALNQGINSVDQSMGIGSRVVRDGLACDHGIDVLPDVHGIRRTNYPAVGRAHHEKIDVAEPGCLTAPV